MQICNHKIFAFCYALKIELTLDFKEKFISLSTLVISFTPKLTRSISDKMTLAGLF